MSIIASNPADTGLEVLDIESDPAFGQRRLHTRDVATQIEGMHRLARAFVTRPDTILQELVEVAVDLCGADSAGISVEQEEKTDENFWHWVATSGSYSGFLNATLPRYPSACGVCLERGRPQLFRVTQRFFDLMGVDAPTVTDGLLLPWETEETRGTIWIMAHGRTEAFDGDDSRMMQVLANFAAMGVRQQRQQKKLMEQASATAAAAMANDLAHKINNPLQSMTNIVYLAAEGKGGGDAKALAQELSEHVERLSVLVEKLLELPIATIQPK
ncbi:MULTISPECIES: GAF domain-containing protein [Acidobacteriaceae]|uniref:GAF domain-containing protein n=1 Tax=Acidobacteriaceae TaxID=204434 RepID=UPI00131DE41C|nr:MULTISPECIES: GAF domain-containing protein [Acidobacteriaceae]MDW5265587.1 GAF domain-containing protein [Edaphobacter sp.]